jgi:hypothetical protein
MSYGYRLSKCENSRLMRTLSFLLLLCQSRTKRRCDDVADLWITAYTLYRSSCSPLALPHTPPNQQRLRSTAVLAAMVSC